MGPRPWAISHQLSALRVGNRHSALGTRPRRWGWPSMSAVAQSHGQSDGTMSTPVRLERATEDGATEVARSSAHAQFKRADDSAHIRSTRSLAAERGPEGCAEHPDPCSRRPRAVHVSFQPLTWTSPPLRTLEGVGGPMPVSPLSIPVLDSILGSQCCPRRRTGFGDRRRCERRGRTSVANTARGW